MERQQWNLHTFEAGMYYYLRVSQDPTTEEIRQQDLERVDLFVDGEKIKSWWVRNGLGSHLVYSLQDHFSYEFVDLDEEDDADEDDTKYAALRPNWSAFVFRYDIETESVVGYSSMYGDQQDTKHRSLYREPLDA